MTDNIDNSPSSKEIDIIKLLTNVWKDKLYIMLITLFSLIICIIVLNNKVYKFEVVLKVTPTEEFNTANVKSSLGGLATIIGMTSQTNTTVDPFIMYKALIRSRLVSSKLAEDKDFISKHFKEFSSQLIQTGSEEIIDNSWRADVKTSLGLPNHKKKYSIVDYIISKQEEIEISTQLSTKVTTLKMIVEDPKLGIEFLEKIHEISDSILRQRQIRRTDEYIKFLNRRLSLTKKQDQRLSLISTLAEQQRSRMIATSEMAFAAEYFGQPYQSPSPIEPRVRNYIIFYFLSGFFGSIFISVLKYFVFNTKN